MSARSIALHGLGASAVSIATWGLCGGVWQGGPGTVDLTASCGAAAFDAAQGIECSLAVTRAAAEITSMPGDLVSLTVSAADVDLTAEEIDLAELAVTADAVYLTDEET